MGLLAFVAPSDGTTLTGTYTVDAADSSVSILSVDSFTPVIVLDIAGNALQDTAVPGFPNNLSDSSTLEIDTAPPSIVIHFCTRWTVWFGRHN